jgi:hypothetical protein
VVVPDGAEEDDGAEDDDVVELDGAGLCCEPDPFLAPSSCPTELVARVLFDCAPDEEAAVGLPPPPAAEADAVVAVRAVCWVLVDAAAGVAARLAADAVQPVCEGCEPAGA